MNVLQMEQERYESTKEKIKTSIEEQRAIIAKMTNEAMTMNRQMMKETSNDFGDEDVRAEISQNLQMYANSQNRLNHNKEQLIKLEKLYNKPYFGRFDFTETGYEREACYIGIGNYLSKDPFEILVYDWRAPICSLFYEGHYGKISYEAPEGPVHGEISLKRHFHIEKSIDAYYDMEEHPSDPVLLEVLSQKRGEKLYPIVQSIQKKQNEIIRMKDIDLLSVQGVPGSGKSIIALHRMAYLLYHGQHYNHQNMVILSPNDFFKQYIEGVLPDLGEASVTQYTFEELISNHMRGEHFNYDAYMDQVITGIIKQNKFKQSLEYVDHLKAWFAYYMKHIHRYEDISFRGKIVLSKEEIKNKVMNNLDKPLQITMNQLKEKAESFISHDLLEKKVQAKEAVLKLKQAELNPKGRIKHLMRLVYRQFQKDLERVLSVDGNQIFAAFKRADFRGIVHKSGPEDLYGRLLMKMYIYPEHTYKHVKYVLVDECQDYNAIKYTLIQNYFKQAHVTLLGDMNQTIQSSKNKDFDHMIKRVFKPKSFMDRSLTTCYRSTGAIVETAKQYMKTDMVSVGREGERPIYLQSKRKDLKHVIKEHIKDQTTIITATYAQAKYLHETLNLNSQLLDKETLKMDNDLLIMPIYYAKGMEFDHVIYVRDQVHEALQAQVDYTAITRAKHQLTLIDLKDHFAS